MSNGATRSIESTWPKKEMEIRHECEQEEYLLNTNDPELRVVLQFPQDRERLWERQRTDDDFLHVRIGVGNRPMLAEIRYPEQRFSMDDDPLEQQMYALAGKQVFLGGCRSSRRLMSSLSAAS